MIQKVFVLFLLLCLSIPQLFADPPSDGWKIKWQDEFNGSSLDLTKWDPNNNYIQNGQNTCYTDDNYEVSDGTLKLIVRKESNACGVPYTGARLESKIRDDRYVYYEAKLRYLCETPGFWGNFWTIGYDGNRWQWPPEFDMAEMTSNHPNKIWMVYHYEDNQGEHQTDGDWVENIDWKEWHTYAFQWDRNEKVKFYVDGVHVNTANDAPIWHQYMYVILRMGAGLKDSWGGLPNSSTKFPGIAEYDYVRVYERDGDNTDPVVELTAPQDGETFEADSDILLQAQASDADGNLEKVEFYAGSTKLAEDETSPFEFTWQNVNTGNYIITARAVDSWGATADSEPATITVGDPSQISTILYVAPSNILNANDALIKSRLETLLGCQVIVKGVSNVKTSDALTVDAVLITESLSSGDVNVKFRDVEVPVMTWEPYLYDDMQMTGDEAEFDFGPMDNNSVFVEFSEHSLAAGFAGPVSVTSSTTRLNWGVPELGAELIAVSDAEPEKAFIFCYENGADMIDMTAPERRLGFFMHEDTPSKLTDNGWLLFDAAVNWILYRENTSVQNDEPTHPQQFSLAQNYPNPFNPQTRIDYRLKSDADVSLHVFNIKGETITTLVRERAGQGEYTVTWDGTDAHGNVVPGGIYFYRLQVQTQNGVSESVKKMMLIH